jgi:Der1-like family
MTPYLRFLSLIASVLVINARTGFSKTISWSEKSPISKISSSEDRKGGFVIGSEINSVENIASKLDKYLSIRGGEVISKGKKAKKKSPLKAVKEALAQVAPATRAYLLVCGFCTLVHVLGLPAPELFNLERSKLYELWRPITSVSYFGPPSMSMANNMYFLIRYGQTLETLNGTGEHVWFLLVQTLILTVLGYLFGFPFQAQAMIAATLYASCHLNPMEKM